MRIGRTIPPAASPVYIRDIINGFRGLIRGKEEVERFRNELKDYFDVKHCFLLSSGKAALTIILKALHELHPDREEVLIPAFTCYSVPSAIVRAGLKVKLCDVNPGTLDFNYDQLKKMLSEFTAGKKSTLRKPNQKKNNNGQRTTDNALIVKGNDQEPSTTNPVSNNRLLAVIPVHLFGLPADIDRIRSLCRGPNVTIVEDAAQVLGAKWNEKKLGTLGDVSFFSLGRGKALSIVEGGVIITDREDIAERIMRQLSNTSGYKLFELINLIFKAILLTVFQHPLFFWFPKSLPFLKLGETIYALKFKIKKMSSFQAGLAKNWQNKLKLFQKKRIECAKFWADISIRFNLYTYTSNFETNYLNPAIQNSGSFLPFLRFPVSINDSSFRKSILEKSRHMGLGIMHTYPDSINGIQELKEEFNGQNFPVAKTLAKNLVTLPVHPLVSEQDMQKIIKLFTQMEHGPRT